ncbi:phospholipid-transporting ATPase ABCA1-like [Ruditapes philippinarum]|uniref:phospholipid-transporting ATPase ABCA1-like n=1 Tax=Ruditapes philippinarum TaxID=129788 RepID=UPI00295B0315|nr:phospholipid-transporting ATPase ABCA1-like [Ruditapes philippinarum]XP_060584950.1 phospholipid-transporting ATPase ABCA1-like [Ruditapes philippinarum]
MQFIGGISLFTYWTSSLIWDMLVLGVAVGFSVIILLIFKPGSFWGKQNLEATVYLLLLYGWATMTFAYFLVKRFQNSGTAFFTVFCSLLFVGIFCILMVFSFNYFTSGSDNKRMKDAYDAMRYIFLVFPPYALGGGLLDLIDNQIKTVMYARFNTDVYENPFMIGWHLFAMGVEGCIFFVLTVWLDMRFCCKRTYECSVKESNSEDYDVTAEGRRIDTGDCRSDAVVVRNLHKIYCESSKEVHAVNGLSFGVPSGQCHVTNYEFAAMSGLKS